MTEIILTSPQGRRVCIRIKRGSWALKHTHIPMQMYMYLYTCAHENIHLERHMLTFTLSYFRHPEPKRCGNPAVSFSICTPFRTLFAPFCLLLPWGFCKRTNHVYICTSHFSSAYSLAEICTGIALQCRLDHSEALKVVYIYLLRAPPLKKSNHAHFFQHSARLSKFSNIFCVCFLQVLSN